MDKLKEILIYGIAMFGKIGMDLNYPYVWETEETKRVTHGDYDYLLGKIISEYDNRKYMAILLCELCRDKYSTGNDIENFPILKELGKFSSGPLKN